MTYVMHTGVRLETDFNEIHDGVLLAMTGMTTIVPQLEQDVVLSDWEGNTCSGVVVQISQNGLIRVEPEWSTWQPAPPKMIWPKSIISVSTDDPTASIASPIQKEATEAVAARFMKQTA